MTWRKPNVTCSDSGTYKCVRRNGVKSVAALVHVLCSPKMIGRIDDVITISNRHDQNVSIKFQIISNPESTSAAVLYGASVICNISFSEVQNINACQNMFLIEYFHSSNYSGFVELAAQNLKVRGNINATIIISNGVEPDLMVSIVFTEGQ
ncbi:hypothetical protein Btru_071660 [Bulinus truncatus]|nr:hypothetical protein Btru_071660 [Bulinus truncatus]